MPLKAAIGYLMCISTLCCLHAYFRAEFRSIKKMPQTCVQGAVFQQNLRPHVRKHVYVHINTPKRSHMHQIYSNGKNKYSSQ